MGNQCPSNTAYAQRYLRASLARAWGIIGGHAHGDGARVAWSERFGWGWEFGGWGEGVPGVVLEVEEG